MPTVIVSNVIANKPNNGGNAWVVLSWVLGLQRLGCRVFFVEQIAPQSCFDENGTQTSFAESENLRYFRSVTEKHLPPASAALLCDDEQTWGLGYDELCDVASQADLLVNISGHLADPMLFSLVKQKAYVDLDPGFTQFWQASGTPAARLDGHDAYFTVGENIGSVDCGIPTCGFAWKGIRQPVVLDDWPETAEVEPTAPFTTIASWRGALGRVSNGGKTYGVKAHEFRRFLELPTLTQRPFEVALEIYAGDYADRERLISAGWRLVDPRDRVAGPDAFRQYVTQSKAEFSPAQGIYVETNSGWFSDRTVRYLATGRPALVQDTGFSRNLPVGEGLIPFRTLEEAVAGVERIASDYDHHSRAARRVAQECFDSDKVLSTLLEESLCAC